MVKNHDHGQMVKNYDHVKTQDSRLPLSNDHCQDDNMNVVKYLKIIILIRKISMAIMSEYLIMDNAILLLSNTMAIGY